MKCLKNTFWYVPKSTLESIKYVGNTNTVSLSLDQTVWEITGYTKGYFWGRSTVSIDGNKQYKKFIASITPDGKVLFQFIAYDDVSNIVTGSGIFKHKKFLMQMFSGNDSLMIGHWSYMLQTKPGDKSWNRLPGTNESVPVFMKNCPPAPTFKT